MSCCCVVVSVMIIGVAEAEGVMWGNRDHCTLLTAGLELSHS